MWKITFISLSFLTFGHSSTFPDTISGTVSDSISTVKNLKGNDLTHFVSIVKPALAAIDVTKHLISPTQSMNTSQLIEHYSCFKTEEHTVISDGYKLNMVRIPGDGHAVFLMHGFLASSDDWMGLGNDSLTLILARNGYDVWLGNARGNTYSRENINFPTTDPQFWDFSFHELGTRDLPVFIDYIRDTVGEEKKFIYVGHSQGTTMAYTLLSEIPEYNGKVLAVLSLAPVAYISNAKSAVFQHMTKNQKSLEKAFKDFGDYEVFRHVPPTSTMAAICGSSKLLQTICFTMFFSLFGSDYDRIDYDHAGEQLNHYLAGGAWKQVLHFVQNGAKETFRKYDYGKKGNMKKYGTRTPPKYELGNISTNMSMYYCDNDWLSDEKDVKKLERELKICPNNVHKVNLKNCNHVYFTYGKGASTLYNKILEDINNLCS